MQLKWKKPSSSQGDGNCVEWAFDTATDGKGYLVIRDSKNPNGPVLKFTRGEYEAFLKATKNDEMTPDA